MCEDLVPQQKRTQSSHAELSHVDKHTEITIQKRMNNLFDNRNEPCRHHLHYQHRHHQHGHHSYLWGRHSAICGRSSSEEAPDFIPWNRSTEHQWRENDQIKCEMYFGSRRWDHGNQIQNGRWSGEEVSQLSYLKAAWMDKLRRRSSLVMGYLEAAGIDELRIRSSWVKGYAFESSVNLWVTTK